MSCPKCFFPPNARACATHGHTLFWCISIPIFRFPAINNPMKEVNSLFLHVCAPCILRNVFPMCSMHLKECVSNLASWENRFFWTSVHPFPPCSSHSAPLRMSVWCPTLSKTTTFEWSYDPISMGKIRVLVIFGPVLANWGPEDEQPQTRTHCFVTSALEYPTSKKFSAG